MIYTPEDFIQYILITEPDLKQYLSEKKFSEIFSEPLNCGKITLDRKKWGEEWQDIYKFEYNKGHLLYFNTDVFDAWYLQKKRDLLLEDLCD